MNRIMEAAHRSVFMLKLLNPLQYEGGGLCERDEAERKRGGGVKGKKRFKKKSPPKPRSTPSGAGFIFSLFFRQSSSV